MAQIYIRGQKPIKTTRERAESVKKMFEDDQISALTVIALEGLSVRKEDIKFIILDDDETAQEKKLETGTLSVNEIEQQHQNNIDERLNLPIIERAKKLDEFTVYYETLTGEKPSQEQKLEAAKLQLGYFKENNWAFPALSIFTPIVEASGKMKKTLNMIEVSILELLSRHCASAIGRVSRREYAKSHEQPDLL